MEFINLCKNNKLHEAKIMYTNNKINIHKFNDLAFRYACCNGHLEIAQWLLTLDSINISVCNNFSFGYACRNGHLEVAQWLYSLKSICNASIYDAFCWSCKYGQLNIVNWLISYSKPLLFPTLYIDIAYNSNNMELVKYLIKYFIKNKELTTFFWLFSNSCEKNKFKLVKLLIEKFSYKNISEIDRCIYISKGKTKKYLQKIFKKITNNMCDDW